MSLAAALDGACVSLSAAPFEYRVCFGRNATQRERKRERLLGVHATVDERAFRMTRGERCPPFGERNTTVEVACHALDADALRAVHEPTTCSYVFHARSVPLSSVFFSFF